MNNIYRVVWNASLGAWIVVSETAKSKTKSQSKTVGTLMSAALLGFAGNIYAAASTGGLGNGTVISASGCTSAASTSSVGGVAVGCGSKAAADSGILDRQNPFNNGTTANLNGINWSSGSGAAGGTTALGSYAEANGGLSTAIGTNAKATEVASVAVGVAALSTGNTSLAIGRQSAATADYAQAIGNVAAATAKGTLAIGHSATATGYRAIAIGSPDIENAASVGTGQQGNGYQTTGQTKATAKDSIAFGGGAQATKDNALAIGAFSESSGEKSVAIGTGAKATANNAVVIGDGASTKVVGGVALGMGATVNGENSAAVGLNSVAEAQTGSSFLTNVAATTQGTVSFGDVSTKRRLTNLADGAIDSDAVTVAQLKKQKVLTDQQGTDTALAFGGGAIYDPVTGGMTQPSYVVNKNADGTGGTTVNNAGAAISNVDSRTTLLENQTWKLQANGDSGTAVAADANVSFNNGKNIKIERNGTDINVATADDVDFKTVAVGGTGGIALNGTTKKISGLAGGVIGINSTEAINGSQLNGAMNSVSSILGGGVSNTAGTVGGTFTVGTKQYNSVAEAIADAGAEVVEGNNISVSKNGNTYTVATAKNVNFDSVTVSGVAINKTSGDITGLSNTNFNAADFASKGRAATEEQLKLVKDAQDTTDLFAVKYDQNADGSVNKDSVTFAGTSAVKNKAVNGRITTIGGTSLNNVASAGDYKDIDNAAKGVNAGDLNNAVLDATEAATTKGLKFGNGAAANHYKLGDAINVHGSADGSISSTLTGDGVVLGLGSTVKIGSGMTQITVDGTAGKIGGLSNKAWNAASITSGQAATEDQLKAVSDAQTLTDAFAVKYDKNADGSVNKDSVTFAGTSAVKTKAVNGRITTIGGTSLNNVASAGDYKDIAHADKGVNAGDLNNAVLDAAGSVKNIIGGSTTVNADGSISNSNIGGTGASTIDGAIKNVSTAAKAAKTEVKKGDNIEIAETTGADGQSIYTVSTAKDLNLNSVMVNDGQGNITLLDKNGTKVTDAEGNASQYGAKGLISKNQAGESTVLNQNGLSFTDAAGASVGPSMNRNGINAGGAKILNVGSGTIAQSSQDAVNGGQISTIVSSIQNSIGGNTTVNNDGSITTSDIGGTGQSTIDDAIKSVKDLADQTNDFAVKYDKNADGTVNKDNVTFSGTKANSIQDADGRIDTVGGTSLNNVASAGDYKDVANASKAVNAGDLNNAILDASNHVKDIIGGNTTVNADGSISNSNIGGTGKATIDEAIAQVGNAAKAAKTVVTAGNNITVTNKGPGSNGQDVYEVATAADVSFDSITTKAVTVGDVKITENGINAGNKQINNVADGATNQDSKDAVNGSQLNATNQKVAEFLGGGAKFENGSWTAPSYTVGHGDTAQNFGDVGGAIDALNNADQALGNRITNLGDRLEQVFIDTNQKIDDVEKKANAGVAAAMALENAPFIAGKYTYAVGAAYHGGENAIGVTLRKTSDNGRWSLTGGIAAASQGDPSVRIGISGVID